MTGVKEWDGDNYASQFPVFLLDLDWDGVVYRLATVPITIQDTRESDATNIQYHGGLGEVEWEHSIDVTGSSAGGVSIPLSVILPENVNLYQEVIVNGHSLASATGELSVILVDWNNKAGEVFNGQPVSYADRIPIVRGHLSQPVFGYPDDISRCDFSLENLAPSDIKTLIPSRAVVSFTTYPHAPDDTFGKVYPFVIGSPGVVRLNDGVSPWNLKTVAGSPAYMVIDQIVSPGNENKSLMVAGHPVAADKVTIIDADGAQEKFDIYENLDRLGRMVSLVRIEGASTISLTSATYYASWTDGGGLVSPETNNEITYLGDVLIWAFRNTAGVDISKWIAERPVLNRIKVDTYLNDPTITPYEWVRNNFLDLVGLQLRDGPFGVSPSTRIPTTDTERKVATIIEGPDFAAVGPIVSQTELTDIINTVTLQYAPSAQSATDYRRTITISDDPGDSAENDWVWASAYTWQQGDPDAYSNAYAVLSASRYGVRSETIEAPWIYDESSAGLLISERVRNKGFMLRTRDYEASPAMGWLLVGDFIVLSSDDGDTLVEIVGKSWDGLGWSFTVLLSEDPLS